MSISSTVGVISGINECVSFFQWARSAISSLRSRWSGKQEQNLQDEVLHLQSGLQYLSDTLPAMYNLIDRAEWRSHEHCVAELLPKFKDAVYDADDLLDEFRWYEQKVTVEGNASQFPFIDFFDSVIHGNFNKVTEVQKRLENLSNLLGMMSLRETATQFDKSVRPETSSFPVDATIFGRDQELTQVMKLLGVPVNSYSRRAHSKRKRASYGVYASENTSAAINQIRIEQRGLAVLPIVGIGGVGKTTMAQHICNHKQVKNHFKKIIWICVSDDFDVKRLTKETIQSFSGKEKRTDHLDSLQHDLSEKVSNLPDNNSKGRLLIVLDYMWEDTLKNNGQCWKKFCAPFTNVPPGSMMLVTTRSQKVADAVCTMNPFSLEGLNNDDFWTFFKLCSFGSEGSSNVAELECIGRSIVPKLKGSPLAAKTVGRLLKMNLDATHWDNVLQSELWELRQEETDILPALRLSYMYLPFYLKRCFSLCAVYPKDHEFKKEYLAEIWVAQGYVDPQGDIPVQDIACQYFEDLVSRSFFQEVCGTYVIHDLVHDMVQMVSKHDCFILKNMSDFQKIPQNVRHLSVLSNTDFDCSKLLKLSKHAKLRTLICSMSLEDRVAASVMGRWCSELGRIRVIICASINELPDSIGNLKHLRCLVISRACALKSLPSTFYCLYNLQILSVGECKLESLPSDLSKLISLRRFECGFRYYLEYQVNYDAPESEQKRRYLHSLKVHRSSLMSHQNNGTEALKVLQPPMGLKYLQLLDYPGVSLPSWFHLQKLRSSLISPPSIGVFSSLMELTISSCQKLSSLEHFLHPSSVPAIKKITVKKCERLLSIATERFVDLHCLEELEVVHCPNICSQSLVSSSLKMLVLCNSGNLGDNIECCSLTKLLVYYSRRTSTPMQHMPALQGLDISRCESLMSVRPAVFTNLSHCGCSAGSIASFSSLTVLNISGCIKLSTLDDLLLQEYLPAIERIYVANCGELLSLPGERFGSFLSLKDLEVYNCPGLNWQRGLVLPSTIRRLFLGQCGDISAWIPSCLQDLASLVSLEISECQHIISIPGDVWSRHLSSLEQLYISDCPDLVSIGGPEAVAKLKTLHVSGCLKMKELKQPVKRGGT